MLKKKITKILTICLIGIALFMGGVLYNKNKAIDGFARVNNGYTYQQNTSRVEVLNKGVVVNELHRVKKLILLEQENTVSLQLKKEMIWNLGSTIKNIQYTYNCGYYADLNNIKETQVIVSDKQKTITMYINYPSVVCELLDDKTLFKDEKSGLIHTDIKLKPEEMESYRVQSKQDMLRYMSEKNNRDMIERECKNGLKELIKQITNYGVEINFVG